MNEILEIKGKIYEVIDGQVTKIKVDETIFEIKSLERRTEIEPTEDTSFVEEIKTKFCARCRETKPVSEFHTSVSRPDKLQTYCKPCMNIVTFESHKKKEEKKKEEKTIEKKERGQMVGIIKRCYIYENILNDIKQGIAEGKKYPQLMEIVKEYAPMSTKATLHWYVNMYKRFIKEKGSPRDRGDIVGKHDRLSIYSNILEDIKTGIEEQKSNDDLINIISEYYPHIKKESCSTYLWIYKTVLGKDDRKEPIRPSELDRGPKVTTISGVSLYQNIIAECEVEKDKGNYYFSDILRKYHPDITENSIGKYSSVYRKHLGVLIGRGRGKRIKNKTFFSIKPFVRKKKKRKRKPSDAVGFCKTYKTWILKDEYLKVRRAVNSWNFVATTESIAKKTRLPALRVRATLRYLTDKHEVYWKRNDELVPIYHPCI